MGNSTPAPPKTPEPIVTKICMGDYVGDPYPYAKFHNDPITHFCPPNVRKFASSDSASFFLGGGVLPTVYSQDPCTDFYNQYINWRRFAQGCALWGLEIKNLYFDPIFPQNGNISPIFHSTNFRLKKTLTVGMLTYKLPLIIIVAP